MGARPEVELGLKVNQDTPDLQDSKETEDLRVCLDPPAPPAVPSPQCRVPLGLLVFPESEDRRESLESPGSPCQDPPAAQEPPDPRASPVSLVPLASPQDRTASQGNQAAPGRRARGASPEPLERRVTKVTPV